MTKKKNNQKNKIQDNKKTPAAAKQQTEATKQQTEAMKQQTEAAKQQTEAAKQQTEATKQQTEAAKQQTEAAKQQTEAAKQQTEADIGKPHDEADLSGETTDGEQTPALDAAGQQPDPKKKDAPRHEDSLDMHFMSRRQRTAYKLAQHKEKTRGMTAGQRFRFFFDYYKWQAVLTVSLIAFAVLLGRSVYLNTRPMALGLIVLNDTPSQETDLPTIIETDYRKFYTFNKHDRFMVITGLSIDPINYESETVAAGANGLSDYESLYYLTSGGSIDVLLSDYDGLSYCVEQDLVYPMDMLFTEEALAPYEQRVKFMSSYTGEWRSYAIDVSDSPYLKKQNLGYTSAYIMFPANNPENTARALRFLEFLLQP